MKLDDSLESSCKKQKKEPKESEKSGVKLNDLPELPFEKILSYVSLQDRLKLRGVSCAWCQTIDRLRVTSLLYSNSPSGSILGKGRWINGTIAQNFISSPGIESFVNTFVLTILVNLKNLRLCKIRLEEKNKAAFARSIESFGQLLSLSFVHFDLRDPADFKPRINLQLNLPMLSSIEFDEVHSIEKLTLDTPRLQKVKLVNFSLSLDLLFVESVELLIVDRAEQMKIKQLKNLKYLYSSYFSSTDSTLLLSLKQLKEVHLDNRNAVSALFEQKKLKNLVDLKIFLRGCLLNSPDDPAINTLTDDFSDGYFAYLAENQSRLADEIPFKKLLTYTAIERVEPGLEMHILNKLTDLHRIDVAQPVQDVQRFLGLLKNCNHIVWLQFFCNQPRDLLDQLTEHCAVQKLAIDQVPSDFGFHRLKRSLMDLTVRCSINVQTIRKALKELEFLSWFDFKYLSTQVKVSIDHQRRFQLSINNWKTTVDNPEAAIRFIIEKTPTRANFRLTNPFFAC